MATITQIIAAQTPKPPCNTCGHRPRAGSIETTPSPVSRTSSYTAVSVPPTVSEQPSVMFTPETPLTRMSQGPRLQEPPSQAANRWRRAIATLRTGIAFGRKGG